MVRDGVANLVSRLRERGWGPRRVGHDAWVARCPAHRSLDYALSITRNEFNHVVIQCRSAANCDHTRIVRALGFNNDLLYAETPQWLIDWLRRVPVEPEKPAEIAIVREPPEIAREPNESALSLAHESSHGNLPAATVIDEANDTAAPPDNGLSHAVALASTSTADDAAPDAAMESPTEALMRLACVDRVILGSDGRSYALVFANGKAECRELRSRALRNLLTHAALKATGKLPTPEAVAAVVGVLEASAEFDGTHEEVFLRVARGPSGSSYFLDLADRERRIIEVRPDGWALAAAPAVLFRRPAGQLELPLPEQGGALELLKKYVNVDEADWPLFIGWLTAALRPVGPHPILVVTGEQGAAKTTMLRVCRRLIDPHASPVRTQPKELRDLMIAARKSWLMAYDNVTALPGWLSDGLCGLATGTGFTVRSLGTDDDETIFVAQRPIIINGINDFVDKADLGDRSIFLHLPRISRSVRQTEEAFWADFDRDCPRILGGLLDAVSAGMRALADVRLAGLSRLADAERWGEAVTRGLGGAAGTFSSALGTNRAEANEWTLEESPVAMALIDLAIRCPLFRGTMEELLQALTAVSATASVRSADWPKSPRALSVKVRQLAPQLRSIGIDVEFRRETTGRFMTVAMAADENRSDGGRGRALIGKRLRAHSEQSNRAVG